jgi:hypothetical protein
MTKEELASFEKEGFGRFNLRQSAEVHPAKRTRTGPRRVITNRPTRELVSVGYDRTKYVPRIVKDAMGNDVRVLVKKGNS